MFAVRASAYVAVDGVVGGNGLSCVDCKGVEHGTSQYDVCGICSEYTRVGLRVVLMCACAADGSGSTCAQHNDCHGVLGGTSVYDVCDVCGE
jgi:hypothetical protein